MYRLDTDARDPLSAHHGESKQALIKGRDTTGFQA
jgi:hypothetical protein